MAHDLNPYLQEYFKVYQPNQKLVILKMLQNLGFYDEALFTNFTNQFLQLMQQPGGVDAAIKATCMTLHPLTMEYVDRTFELLDVLNFHMKHGKVELSKQDRIALAIPV